MIFHSSSVLQTLLISYKTNTLKTLVDKHARLQETSTKSLLGGCQMLIAGSNLLGCTHVDYKDRLHTEFIHT